MPGWRPFRAPPSRAHQRASLLANLHNSVSPFLMARGDASTTNVSHGPGPRDLLLCAKHLFVAAIEAPANFLRAGKLRHCFSPASSDGFLLAEPTLAKP